MRRVSAPFAVIPLVLFFCVPLACGGGGGDGGKDLGPGNGTADGGAGQGSPGGGKTDAGGGGAAKDAGSATPTCVNGEATCTDHATARACVNGQWQTTSCASGSGCVQGACSVSACSDECALGDVNGAKSCALVDAKTGGAVSNLPATSTNARARAYQTWLRKDGLPFGGVANAHYSDPGVFSKVDVENDIGDSALFTGTYLAAEALRLRATGSSEARASVERLVRTMHLFANVSGEAGILARYALKSGATLPFAIPDLDCSASRVHCKTPYAGETYDFIGDISRDQYQGLMLGYAIAYEALGSAGEDSRALIRADVVTLVTELMKDRSVPVHLTYNGISLPVNTVTMRFVVLDPREMDNGAVDFIIESTGSKAVTMHGFQEFTPDLADVVRQFPGLGLTPPIVRASSAIMLASFFRVALMVTDGVPASKKDRDAILAYYTSHPGTGGSANDWLALGAQWSSNDGCGNGYYANNITMEPMYNLARLEDDPQRRTVIRDQILNAKMWPAFVHTKNPFFSFIYTNSYPAADPTVAPDALAQLSGFVAPPNVQRAVDLRTNVKYPHDATCADQVDHATAVDVGDRPPGDFMWQRAPWSLYDVGNPGQTFPGVDYLVAYWMGRDQKLIADDTPGACLVWK